MRQEPPLQQAALDTRMGGPSAQPPSAEESLRLIPVAPTGTEVELDVSYAIHQIPTIREGQPAADEVNLRSYNGKLVGPVIEARPGETLKIRLRNNLPFKAELVGTHPHDGPHGFNVTNLHYHGLHVSPAGNSDNVLIELGPGREFEYEVTIPDDHHPGTCWYHAHKHGAVGIQLGSGLAGALIVRGDIDEVPAIQAAKEQILVLQQIPYALVDDPYQPGTKANMVENFEQLFEVSWNDQVVNLGRRVTLNGEVEPIFTMQPGEVQRWRFIQAGIHNPFRLRMIKDGGDGSIAGPRQYQIALDGITTGRLDQVAETELHPGYRADVLMQAVGEDGAPLEEGTYLLIDEAEAERNPTALARILARIEVRADPCEVVSTALPTPEELAPLAPFSAIEDAELTSGGMQLAIFEVKLGGTDPAKPFKFLVNGKEFNPHDPPRELTLGAVEEWFIASVGDVNFKGHPFHIHTNPFQYKDKDGRIIWKDTVFVPRGESLTLRTRYQRYIGKFMLHCHIVGHEDDGMMEMLELVLPSPEQAPAAPAPGGTPPSAPPHSDLH